MTPTLRRPGAINRYARPMWAVAAFVVILAAVNSSAGEEGDGPSRAEALSPVVPPGQLDPRKVSIGRQLFHDPILSKRGTLSCSSCHDLSAGGTIAMRRTVGYEGTMHAFNAPTIFNVGNNHRLGWKGSTTSLAVQNLKVLLDPNLMGNQWEVLLPRLNSSDAYRTRFTAVYGRAADADAVLDALVTFQKSLVTPDAPFDRFLKGDKLAISGHQKLGYKLFQDYGCISCHQGSNVGGNMLQIFGVFGDPGSDRSLTTSEVEARLDDSDRSQDVFRVPSLRNVELTAPYFHDGRTDSLREAIAIMAKSQLGRELPDGDIYAIELFLKSLTGSYDGKALASPAAGRQ